MIRLDTARDRNVALIHLARSRLLVRVEDGIDPGLPRLPQGLLALFSWDACRLLHKCLRGSLEAHPAGTGIPTQEQEDALLSNQVQVLGERKSNDAQNAIDTPVPVWLARRFE